MSEIEANKLSLRPEYWRYFAGEAAKGGDCPLYEAVSNAIADDAEVQAITLTARPGQPPANMLFAAVHYALLDGAEHALRCYYSHLLKRGEAEAEIGLGTYGVFRDFVMTHRAVIDPLIAARVTNTNEVRRCSFLRAGYATIAARTNQKLHIVELGPSAGLNLNWDRYAYHYVHADGRVLDGGPASNLTIDSAWRGETPPPVPSGPPVVAARIGLELNPVDLTSAEDRRWLLALLWPGLPDRIERMRKALEIAVQFPPPIRVGDALAHLPEELEKVAPGSAAIVAHSMVTYQWNQPMWDRLEAILTEASARRPIFRLFQDSIERSLDPAKYPLRLRIYDAGAMREEVLGEVHHHGAWVDWAG
ncbi:hypothetical protein sos41_15210 [Alphaproteobacteria bacterium SO-S41]|nr:hypothetical protein sos41_15210 [Alphaproteobacteria bacterium SO-S41]